MSRRFYLYVFSQKDTRRDDYDEGGGREGDARKLRGFFARGRDEIKFRIKNYRFAFFNLASPTTRYNVT